MFVCLVSTSLNERVRAHPSPLEDRDPQAPTIAAWHLSTAVCTTQYFYYKMGI